MQYPKPDTMSPLRSLTGHERSVEMLAQSGPSRSVILSVSIQMSQNAAFYDGDDDLLRTASEDRPVKSKTLSRLGLSARSRRDRHSH